MHNDKHSLIGMTNANKWKQDESVNGDAIIAIDEAGYGHMIVMLTSDAYKIQSHSEWDVLPELEYSNTIPGLYYANMEIRPIYEDVEIDWHIVKPLYPIVIHTKYNKIEPRPEPNYDRKISLLLDWLNENGWYEDSGLEELDEITLAKKLKEILEGE